MKNLFCLILSIGCALLTSPAIATPPQTINYQGYLTSAAGVPVTDGVLMTFRLYNAESGGSAIWTGTEMLVPVTNGAFSVVLGKNVPITLPFDVPYWLSVAINMDGEMAPRQPLTSSPYAFRARSADGVSSVATIAGSQITGTISPSNFPACGANEIYKFNGMTWVCAALATGGSVTSVGTGNGLTGGPITGTGTIGLTATQLLPTTPPCTSNQIPKWNGSAWACAADLDTNSGGTVTSITAGAGLTGGTITGSGTIALDPASTALTGNFIRQNGNALGTTANIGTTDNQPVNLVVNGITALQVIPSATGANLIGGYDGNSVTAGVAAGVVSGGGSSGTTGPTGHSCGTSCANRVADYGGSVGGGIGNQAGDAAGTTTDAAYATVGGGFTNTASGTGSTVGGGYVNRASSGATTVGGGYGNTASNAYSSIGGGWGNTASGSYSTVGGGHGNTAMIGVYGTVGGGQSNNVSGTSGTVGGGEYNTASGTTSVIGGGYTNQASGVESSIGGGHGNVATAPYSTISGGISNNATASAATVAGGGRNSATGGNAFVAGGTDNIASGPWSFAGGNRAKTETDAAVVHDGAFVFSGSNDFDFRSAAANEFAVRATGGARFVTAIDGAGAATRTTTIDPSGNLNIDAASAINFNPATRQMLNLYNGSYGIGVQFSAMYFRADGEFQWFKGGAHNDTLGNAGAGGARLMYLGSAGLTVNGTITPLSDRNAKENFATIDTKAVLEKVVTLPLESWNYRADDKKVRHFGPMAQDFFTAFAIGPDDKHIATVDADGVALAAIQGLNAKLDEREAALRKLLIEKDAEIAELKRQIPRIAALEQQSLELAELKAQTARLVQLLARQNRADLRVDARR